MTMIKSENVFRAQLDPSTGFHVSIVLLRDVKNSATLKEKVMSGTLECSIVKAGLIADPFQIVVAANKAAVSFHAKNMVTKSLFTELLFNLSISKNITQSLIKFGIDEKDTDILIVTMDQGEGPNISQVVSLADGRVAPLAELQTVCDTKLIRKSYKIGEIESKVVSLLDSIVSRITTCDFVSL